LIKIIFIVAFGSILLIELLLKRFPAKAPWIFSMGDIYLKLCYSLCAAIVFYFINQHLPKEKRKLKSLILVSNRLVKIHQEIYFLVLSLNVNMEQQNFSNVKRKMINDACSKINPNDSVIATHDSVIPFLDWYEYFNYKEEKIRSLIKDLSTLNDLIDSTAMYYIYNIDQALGSLSKGRQRYSNTDLLFWSSDIWTLMIDSEAALKNRGKNWHNREREHSKNFIKNKEGNRYLPNE
jgi:hypothetical protein